MFLRIGSMELKAEDKKYVISVGYLIPDDEKVEDPKVKPEFVYIIQSVVNDKLEEAVSKVESIIKAEKCRVDRIEEMLVANKEEIIHEFLMEDEFDNSSISNKLKENKWK